MDVASLGEGVFRDGLFHLGGGAADDVAAEAEFLLEGIFEAFRQLCGVALVRAKNEVPALHVSLRVAQL